jgi:serine/threonine-protein kinase ULK/ATG1
MEYCTGSDLSIYIKNRGKVATLDFEPRPSMFVDWAPKSENEGKVYWPHPTSGGIDERVTRNFLGQLGTSEPHGSGTC